MNRFLYLLLLFPLLLWAKPKVVFIAGIDSHGPGAHEFTAGCKLLAAKLNETKLVDCTVVYEAEWPKTNDVFESADTIIVYGDGYHKHPLNHDGRWQALDGILKKGTGFGTLHYACEAFKDPCGMHMLAWTGGYYERGWSTNPFWTLDAILDKNHPVSRGVQPFQVTDEWYFNMRFTDKPGLSHVLRGKPNAKARSKKGEHGGPHIQKHAGREETTLWAFERPGGGRGFGFTGGHAHKNWRNDEFRKIVLNAILWSAGADVPAPGVVTPTPTDKEMALPKDPTRSSFERNLAKTKVSKAWPKAFQQQPNGNSFTTISNKPLRTRGQVVTLAGNAKLEGVAVAIVEAPKTLPLLNLFLRHGDQLLARYTFRLPQDLKANDVLQLSFPTLAIPAGRFSFLIEPVSQSPFSLRLRENASAPAGNALLVGDESRTIESKSLAYALIGSSTQPTAPAAVAPPVKRKPQAATSLGLELADPDLEITLWAESPLLYNPTNADVDAEGRLWVTEAVNYRGNDSRKGGDRVVVLEDTDQDGKADKSTVFVQDPAIRAPMGIAVIDNRIYVSQTPEIMVYVDVNRNLVFDEGDRKEVFLDGFVGKNHDHSTHSVIGGPDGKLYFNQGNCGAKLTDRDGRTFSVGSHYFKKGGSFVDWSVNPTEWAGQKSADGHVWVSGFTGRMNPDGTNLAVVGHGYRNSYEQILTSFGDVFQNDNDDPPACRTSFVPEGAFFGYCSEDGKFGWSADRMGGQSIPEAQWRTHLPGTFPPGDVYGSGSPTGITFYENGALPKRYQGSLFSCEPARRTVFRYQPKAEGATFALEREVFLKRTDRSPAGAFSDVTVSTDGVLYLCDWYDPMVGGHGARDKQHLGRIYRVAPKGYRASAIKTGTPIERLSSPAHNIRFAGFEQLRTQGIDALPALKNLLGHSDPWIAARAVWLLPFAGAAGLKELDALGQHPDPRFRVAALRTALRNAPASYGLAFAEQLSDDASLHVRRTILTHLRNVEHDKKKAILLKLAGKDFADRTYLEAFGLAVDGSEDRFWRDYAAARGIKSAADWNHTDQRLAWRLHSDSLIKDLSDRALMNAVPVEERLTLIPSLAMNRTQQACDAMKRIYKETADATLKDRAKQFLAKGLNHRWKDKDLKPFLIAEGIIDAKPKPVVPIGAPKNNVGKLNVANVIKLKGDAAKGKISAARCYSCHQFDGLGAAFGPDLKGWAQNRSEEEVAVAIINPAAGIAHGYESHAVTLEPTKERPGFAKVFGILVSDGDPLTIRSQGGLVQKIPSTLIHFHRPHRGSMMLSAHQLGMTEQDVADVVAYLKAYK